MVDLSVVYGFNNSYMHQLGDETTTSSKKLLCDVQINYKLYKNNNYDIP